MIFVARRERIAGLSQPKQLVPILLRLTVNGAMCQQGVLGEDALPNHILLNVSPQIKLAANLQTYVGPARIARAKPVRIQPATETVKIFLEVPIVPLVGDGM